MPKPTTKAAEEREQLMENMDFLRLSLQEFGDRKYIVGIDPSLTNTATAVSRLDTTKVRVHNAPKAAKDTSLSQTNRMAITRGYLLRLFNQCPTQLVAIEGYAYAAAQAREIMGEVGGMIRLDVFWDRPQWVGPVVVVTPGQLKKYILGKSRGQGKEKIMMKVLKDLHVETSNNNEADAVVLLTIAKDLCRVILSPKLLIPQTDLEAREFIKDGHKPFDMPRYRWEVLCSLLKSRCDHSIFDFFNRRKFMEEKGRDEMRKTMKRT